MRTILTLLALLLLAGNAEAQCNRVIRKPQKPRDVARMNWTAAGRVWQVMLSWETYSVSDNGDEEASVGLFVRDNIKRPTIGDSKLYDLTPNRCDLQIDPQLSAVKLMGRDFLLVTLPDNGGSGSVVIAWMYSIDEKGHLKQVLHSAMTGHMWRSPECRNLLRSYIRPESADGSRISWVYEYPTAEWVKKKSECAQLKIAQDSYPFEWKGGCFPALDAPKASADRLITRWDNECITGKGLVVKAAPKK